MENNLIRGGDYPQRGYWEIFGEQGDDDASKRATNVLASIEERLTNMFDEEFNRVANLHIIGHY